MSVEQIIRLLRVFSDRWDAKNIMDDLKGQMILPQAARVYWYFDKLDDAERGSLGDCSKPEEEKERIQAIRNFCHDRATPVSKRVVQKLTLENKILERVRYEE